MSLFSQSFARPVRATSAILAGALVSAALSTVPALADVSSPLEGLASQLELHYDFADAIDDATVSDVSAHSFDGTIVGTGATIIDGAIDLSGGTHVEIPAEVFENHNNLTISTWLRNDQANGNYAALYFGKSTTPPSQYWVLNPANPDGRFKTVLTDGNDAGAPWGTEAGISPTTAARGIAGPITSDPFALYTTVITPTSITGYLNGEKVGSVAVTRTVTDFGTDLVAYIGRSPYSVWGDPVWDGAMADLKVYTAAMTDQQAAAQYFEELADSAASQAAVAEDAAALSVATPVASDVVLPTAGSHGSTIAWASSQPGIIATDGTFNAPASSDATVTLTATLELAGETTTREFVVTATSDTSATLLAHYDFSDSIDDGIVSDVSGRGKDATVVGNGATVNTADGYLTLPGGSSTSGNAYVSLPTGMFDGQNTLTISTWLQNRTGSGNYAAMFFGTTQAPPLQYWLLNPQNTSGKFKSVIVDGSPTSSPWSLEAGISPTSAVRGITGPTTDSSWGMYTTVITPTSITGYYNGAKIGTVATTRTVTQFGTNLVGYIGRSSYGDKFYQGDVRDVRIYTTAFTDAQVANAYYGSVGDDSTIDAALAADADAVGIDGTTVVADVTLPAAGVRGSAFSWASSNPAVIGTDGAVTRPTDVTATVTLTATLSLGGRTLVRAYDVTVIADSPQANLDFAAAAYDLGISVLWEDVALPTTVDGIAVAWASSNTAAVDSDGSVTRTASEQSATLTATFTDGAFTSASVFPITVLAHDVSWIGTGIGSGNTDDADNLRLSFSTDAVTFAALNDGQGVLFPELGSRKMGSPVAFRHPDGGFGLVATLDSNSNRIYVFDSENLYSFSDERLVQFAPSAMRAARVAVDYDNATGAYRLQFTNLVDGLPYEVATGDFVTFAAPVAIGSAPSFKTGGFPSGQIETDAIAVTRAESDAVLARLGRVHSTGVGVFADLDVAKGEVGSLPGSTTVTYSNGTTTEMPVTWDDSAVNWNVPGTYTVSGTVERAEYSSPFVERRADPDVTLGDDGYYYFTGSYPMTSSGDPQGYDRVILRRASTIDGLGSAAEVAIWDESSEAGMNRYIWAPELEKINGEWYILFTAARSGVWDIRPATLHYTGGALSGAAAMDPANWETTGYMLPAAGDTTAFNAFSLDMTHFEQGGVDYAIWAQSDAEGFSTLRMAPMDSANPQQLSAQSIQLSRPTRAWEQASGVEVNEGPAVIMHDGKVIVAFSSASVDAAYNVSVLWADETADLMDPASWTKLGYPLLTTADVPGEFGPGHNSFTVDELGNPVIVYHSRTYGDATNTGEATDGGLYDPRRHARAATVHWDVDGLPLLDMTAAEELDPALADVSMQVTVLPEDNLVVNYLLDETSGTVAVDSSGNGNDATYVGAPTLNGDGGAALDGVDDYVDLPDNILAGLDSITISMDVLVNTTQGTPYFIYGLGNPATSGSGTGYLMATGNSYRNSITPGNWSGEQNTTSGANIARGVWKTITYTLDDATDTSTVYLDGVQVGQSTTTTVKPSQLGGGVTTANYIGRSNYASDKLLSGSVRNFRMYDVALDASAVAGLVASDATSVQRDRLALDLGDTSNVTSNLTLAATGVNGSTITWSSGTPGVVGADGAVTRPSYASGDAYVTLTATVVKGSSTGTRQFLVVVKATVDDQSIADAGAAALAVVNIDDVRGNLTLPAEIDGLPVTWATSDGVVVTTDGVVTRPSADVDVTLTATVTKGSATAQRVFTAKVKAAFDMGALEGYAFAYFTGNTVQGEKIYFAASDGNDALTWDELNGGNPVLTSTYGETGLRDPFVIRSPEGDTFYLIATDLSIGGGTSWDASQRQGSLYLEIWESQDMVNWSDQRHVKVSPDTAGNTWAPEAYYDDSLGAYVVFWASKLYDESDPGHTGSTYNRMMYATTRDFVTFTEPQIWQDGTSRIDSTVTKVDGTYYRFSKDEGAGTTGCSDIIQESSTVLTAPLTDWTMEDSCIGRDAGTGSVEGPSIFHSNPGDVNGDYSYLFVDEYGGRGYIPLRTADIANPDWQVAPSYDLPASPRHGTVIPVTAAELAVLRAAIVTPATAPEVTANADGEVLRYDFQAGAGSTVTDVTGNGYDGTIVGTSALAGGEMVFSGDDYVDIPDNILSGVEDITIEAQVYLDSTLSGNYFIYGLGNTDSGGVGNGYLFTSGNSQYKTSLATGNWSTEQTVGSGSALPRNAWVTLTYTLSGDTASLYLDGVKVTTGTVTTDPTDIGATFTAANYLGKSNYTADGLFKGKYREFAIYNRALSEAEILASAGRADVLTGITLSETSVLKLDPIVDQDAHTVVFPVAPGTDLTALTPVFGTVAGVTAAPASGTIRDLSSGVPVQLAGASTATWTMSAVEMRSPILPGYYADPNVVAYGDTYYIYATTDGVAGWGGKDFYVWSSKDLVNWTRATTPFLTLDGASGNVPWASGNAWAPTITEKDGKFYFYFSGHNASLNRKTIGVAVADNPEGPFIAQPTAMILNNESVTSGQAIDPAAFEDPVTGKYFLFWGNGSPVYAELADDMVSLVPGSIKSISGLTSFREGAFVVYRDGLYHMTYSIDDTGSANYRVGYATATSVTGPWTYRGVILEKDPSLGILATGHNSILNVPGTDDWYIVYHRFGVPGGDGTHRETTIDRLTFDPATGLMQVVTPTLSAVDAQTIVDPAPLTVSVIGTAAAGETLTAEVPAPWTASSYQWAKNGIGIAGATNPTLLLVESDSEADITVTVTASKPLWESSTKTSGATTVAKVELLDPASDELGVSFHMLREGDSTTVWGSGFQPGEDVTVTLYSTPRLLATLRADAAGSIRGTVTIPVGVPAGAHTLEAVGATSGFRLATGITIVDVEALASTGADGEGGAAAALALVLLGMGVMIARRRLRA